MKKTLFFIMTLFAITIYSCSDAQNAKTLGLGKDYKIQLINCDGTITHTWISSGKVLSEQGSDGYFFSEKQTGKLIEVTGTIIITEIE